MDRLKHNFFLGAPSVIYAYTPLDIQSEINEHTEWENNEDAGEYERPPESDPWGYTENINPNFLESDDYINFYDTSRSSSNYDQIVYVSLDAAVAHGMRVTKDACRALRIPLPLLPPQCHERHPSASPTSLDQLKKLRSDIDNLSTIYQTYKEFIVVEPLCQAFDALLAEAAPPLRSIPSPHIPLPKSFRTTRAGALHLINALLLFHSHTSTDTPHYDGQLDELILWTHTDQGLDFWAAQHYQLIAHNRLSEKAFEILSSWAQQLSDGVA